MPQALIKLFSRSNVLMEENDGNGNDLPGSKTPEQLATEKAEADKKAADDKAAADKKAADEAEALRLKNEADGKNKGDDGKPQPTEAEAKLLKEVMERKTKQKDLETQLAALTGALGDLKPDEVAKLVQERKEQERLNLEKRGEYDRILEQVKSEHGKEVGALQARIDELTRALGDKDSNLVELTVGRSFSESAFIREKSVLPPSIARREFGDYVDLVDGVAVVYDKPKGAAERTPIVGADGKPKSFEEGIQALYEKHPDSKSLLRAQGKPGAGSHTDTNAADKGKDNGAIQPGLGRIQHALSKNQ